MTLEVALRHTLGTFQLDVAFEAPAGVTVLFGRSGSGKSTVVNAVAGLIDPSVGRVAVDGELLVDTATGISLPPHRRRIGYVFQEDRLFPHLDVRANLTFGRWFARRRRSERTAPASVELDQVVDLLGIEQLLHRRPMGLSGGEKQRVAIGRALLAEPQLILADEPLAALDEARKGEILPYFERLRDDLSIPILYVSHAAAEVARLATTVVAIEDGRIVRVGDAIDVLADPSVLPTGIRDAGAILNAAVTAHHEDGLTELDAGGERLYLPRVERPLGRVVRVRIAAQDVMLSRREPQEISALNVLRGTISAVRSGDGPGALVSLDTLAGRLLARVTRRSVAALDLTPGTTCFAIVKTVAIAREDVGGA